MVRSPTTGDVYMTDFTNCYKLVCDNIRRKAEIHRLKYLKKPVASLAAIELQTHLLCTGEIASGSVAVWDHHIGKELLRFKLEGGDSTAAQICSKDALFAALDDSSIITIFDIRNNKPVQKINAFVGASNSVLSMQFDHNQILLGTSEGPVVFPAYSNQEETVSLSKSDPHKSRFITKDIVVTSQIGSDELTLLDLISGKNSQFNIPGEQIVDFEVSPDNEIIAVASIDGESKKNYLRTIKRKQAGFDWDQYLKLTRIPYKLVFSKIEELIVVDEQYFQSFGTVNKQYVKALKDKLCRYLR